jgi:hypothetical protein
MDNRPPDETPSDVSSSEGNPLPVGERGSLLWRFNVFRAFILTSLISDLQTHEKEGLGEHAEIAVSKALWEIAALSASIPEGTYLKQLWGNFESLAITFDNWANAVIAAPKLRNDRVKQLRFARSNLARRVRNNQLTINDEIDPKLIESLYRSISNICVEAPWAFKSLSEAIKRTNSTLTRFGHSPLVKIESAFSLEIIDPSLYQVLIKNPQLLHSLHWRSFERLLADILDAFGYEIELQQGSKDGGVDLFAVKKVDPFQPQRFLLQAKRWSNKVGIEPVRQLAFLHSHYRVSKACLATTATFTRGAWRLANEYRWQLELRDFNGIIDWIKSAAILKAK